MKFFTGLINRYLICSFFGILLLIFLNIKNFDLHFTLRGPQPVSSEILIAHIPPELARIEEALNEVRKHSPQLILAPVSRKVSSLLADFPQILMIPRKSLKPDEDGIIRSLNIPQSLLRKIKVTKSLETIVNPSFINFRGPQNTFPSVYFYEIKNQKVLPTTLQKKIIIFDIQDPEDESLSTPVGDLTPAELIANMIDNLLLSRWITPLPFWISIIGIFFITFFVALMILTLSANLAFLGIFVISITISSLSFLLFDQFYIWLPLTAYAIQILVSYFVFINYKLNKKEQLAWRLEKEKIYKDEMDEMKKNFLNLFSHDLKTPIAKILGQIEILEGNNSNPERLREGFHKVRRYSNELNQYVKNILKISQIEANSFQLRLEPCDINSLIQNAVQIIKPLADEKMLVINENLEPLFSINCDKELVQQIILNILENAVKYSPDNTKIQISSFEENEFVVVAVQDEGKGIRTEDQDLVWKKFSRFDEKTEGTGLGLYLVKYFVEAHRGQVFIQSGEGLGSKIGFKIPLKS
jgi:two-component system, OmpR family, phosphate regulon sensor histidine kinase PhoR